MRFVRRLVLLALVCGILTAGAYVLWSRGEIADPAGKTEAHEPDSQAKNPQTAKRFTNRLARETSPYLLLHAHNPVDWYPWGPDAFAKAKKENKPIFLSIGYSSCYWCHVMERLVFSDTKIAKFMNEHFVNIKVDREERPDIDDVYMTSLIVYLRAVGSSQGGGWPLSMFLTPDGKPFAGGTYFPPRDTQGRIGFPSVLRKIASLWKTQRKAIVRNADLLTVQVQRTMKPRPDLMPVKLDRTLVTASADALKQQSDPIYGGVDFDASRPDGPKFPVPVKLGLLQYALRREGDTQAAKVLYRTLDRMAAGGIRDHLGGGFHRYSTDRYWQVPHFEKMLYDQAQLADVYVEAFRRTNRQQYRDVAQEIFGFVSREMTDPGGGFYTALDAETDGVEGAYYVWLPDQIDRVLGAGDAKLFKTVYGFGDPRRFELGFVLHLPKPIDEVAEQRTVSAVVLRRRLAGMRKKLLTVRSKRKRPLRDDKVLTGWNGLMIRALARGGTVLDRGEYIRAAEKAAQFVIAHARDRHGRLRRSYRANRTGTQAYLNDYAFFVEGLLALYDATGDGKWLNAARRLTDEQLALFRDDRMGGFYFTSPHHEALIARTMNAYDNVLPSGNSVTVRNLIRLASLTGQEKYRQIAQQTLTAFAGRLKRSPTGLCNLAVALGEYLDHPDFAAAHRNRPKSHDLRTPATGKKSKR